MSTLMSYRLVTGVPVRMGNVEAFERLLNGER